MRQMVADVGRDSDAQRVEVERGEWLSRAILQMEGKEREDQAWERGVQWERRHRGREHVRLQGVESERNRALEQWDTMRVRAECSQIWLDRGLSAAEERVVAAEADVDRRAAAMAKVAQQAVVGKCPGYQLTASMVKLLLPQLPLHLGVILRSLRVL